MKKMGSKRTGSSPVTTRTAGMPTLFVIHSHTLTLLLIAVATPALSSAYYNNEYFPYTTRSDIAKFWNDKIVLDDLAKESFSYELLNKYNFAPIISKQLKKIW